MENVRIVQILILTANVLVSYRGFRDSTFFDEYSFRVDQVLVYKNYKRLVTSTFLHINWQHLILNMISFYYFSFALAAVLGIAKFLIIYFLSAIGGNALSLYVYKNRSSYSSVGASGAICWLVFATIALFPGLPMGSFFLPIYLPGWVYGILYVVASIYGIRSQRTGVGHSAHLGGGVVGLMTAIVMIPASLANNFIPISLILAPAIIFLYVIVARPEFLLLDNPFKKSGGYQTLDDKYNSTERSEASELDILLEKIHSKGMESLTDDERKRLRYLSQ